MLDIRTLFENEEVLVINKPAGVTVNRSQTTKEQVTVQDYINETLVSQDTGEYTGWGDTDGRSNINKSEFVARSGVVHRLDKDTSGVLVIAKTETAFYDIQNQFKSRKVEKEYYAYLIGEISDDRFEINAPVGRNPRNRTMMAILTTGRPSITTVERDHVFSINNDKYTAVKIFPKTGRTHQIRIHMATINHPVAGDLLYAGNKRGLTTRETFTRLMLHAHKISFYMPFSGEKVEFVAELPKEFLY